MVFRLFAALLCVMLASVAFVGCGGNDSGSSSGTSSGDNAASSDGGAVIPEDSADIVAVARENTVLRESEIDPNAVSSRDSLTFAAVVDPGKMALDNLLDLSVYPLAMAAVEYFMRYDYDNGGFFSPVCDSYEKDADGLGVTFHLTPGIKMQNGDELKAEDIVTSMLAFRNDSGLGWQLDFVDIDKTEILDDYTIDVRFTGPNGVWESSFMMFTVISKRAYEEMGVEQFYRAPVSPAQYQVTEWVSGDHITLTAFKDYYRGEPKIKNFICKVVSDGTASFMELQNGNVNLVWNINADQVKAAAKDENLQLILMENTMINFVGMNATNEALGDFRVRQAIWRAVNRADINLGAYDGFATPAPTIITNKAMGYDPQYETNEPYPPDVEIAKQLLKEAGYENGLTLRLLAESTTNYQLVSEQLSAMLAEVGITLDITLTDYASQNAIMYGGDDKAYDLFLSNSMTSDEEISYIDNPMLYGSCRWLNASDGSGQGFQDILNSIRTTPDIDARTQLYKDMQAYFFEKGLYWIPLNIAQNYIGCDASLTGFDLRGHLIDFNKVYYK
jgi:peptide/nickel transport system substrate-binding protein